MKCRTINILGVKVANMTLTETLEWVRMMVEQGKPRHVVTANAEIIYKAYKEPDFREMLDKADLVTADGSGVVLGSKLLGCPISERVTGIDLVQGIFQLAEEKGWVLYFLGAGPDVVKKAVLNILGKYPRLRIVGYRDGYFSQEETEEVVSNILKAKPEILLVALGVPKQEEFIQKHMRNLNTPISIGVGGSFDVLAGVKFRAPVWMQEKGLEWLYRLYKEPWRYRRMLALPKFVLSVLKQSVLEKISSK